MCIRDRAIDVVIANGENAAPGNGITSSAAEHIFSSGVDFITTGNHAFRRSEVYHFLDERGDIIRPANVGPACPGRGFGVIDMGLSLIHIFFGPPSDYSRRYTRSELVLAVSVDDILQLAL